jgi:hypothetical protein
LGQQLLGRLHDRRAEGLPGELSAQVLDLLAQEVHLLVEVDHRVAGQQLRVLKRLVQRRLEVSTDALVDLVSRQVRHRHHQLEEPVQSVAQEPCLHLSGDGVGRAQHRLDFAASDTRHQMLWHGHAEAIGSVATNKSRDKRHE